MSIRHICDAMDWFLPRAWLLLYIHFTKHIYWYTHKFGVNQISMPSFNIEISIDFIGSFFKIEIGII